MTTILGIETSCDETGAAVVRDGQTVLSNVVATSLKDHQRFGGIIPEIASRRQLECINSVIREALTTACCRWQDINAIAVTRTPGLIGSLLVGLSYARALSLALSKPLVEIDHVQAHLYANFLVNNKTDTKKQLTIPQLPVIGLIVSGGHSSLYLIKSFQTFQQIGQTRDDAAGEAFDKVARILNLGYPGGPHIDRLASQTPKGPVQFLCADLPDSYDFSFSGIKTAVLYHTRKTTAMTARGKAQAARAFQDSVVGILVKKSLQACRDYNIPTLVVGGGVAANSGLRKRLAASAKEDGISVFFPPLTLCIDNAAMIAGLGFHRLG